MLQGKRDVDTVLTMGIMEDVSIIPQPAGGKMIHLFIHYFLVLVNVHYTYCIHFFVHVYMLRVLRNPSSTDTGKVDLTMNVVERVSGGFSAGGGISSGYVMLWSAHVPCIIKDPFVCLD